MCLPQFRERRCQARVYRFSSVNEALRKENCPDSLNDLERRPSLFGIVDAEEDRTQVRAIESGAHDETKKRNHTADRSDESGAQDREEGTSGMPDDGDGRTKRPDHHRPHHDGRQPVDKRDHTSRPHHEKDPSDKKDHESPRHKKRDHSSGHRPDRYGPAYGPDPYDHSYRPAERSDETDDADYDTDYPPSNGGESRPDDDRSSSHRRPPNFGERRPDEPRPGAYVKRPDKIPSPFGSIERPYYPSSSRPDGSANQAAGRGDGRDPAKRPATADANRYGSVERPDGSNQRDKRPDGSNQAAGRGDDAYESTKRPDAKQYGSVTRPEVSNQRDKQRPDGTGASHGSGRDPSLRPDGSIEFGPANRPERQRPTTTGPDRYDYPNQTSDVSESSGKRVPRRGDIGIQSLDEKGGWRDRRLLI